MRLSTAKRRINKTLDELCKSVIDDWYANFKNGYIKGYEDARQGKSPMYAEAYKIADTPQTEELPPYLIRDQEGYLDEFETEDEPQTDCETCELDGKADVCKICRVSNYEPQTDCGWK